MKVNDSVLEVESTYTNGTTDGALITKPGGYFYFTAQTGVHERTGPWTTTPVPREYNLEIKVRLSLSS